MKTDKPVIAVITALANSCAEKELLNGMKRAYSSVNHTEDSSLYLIMLRINLFPHRLNETEIHIKTNASAVCEEAYKCGHCPVMWSTPGGHYGRDTCKMADCRS